MTTRITILGIMFCLMGIRIECKAQLINVDDPKYHFLNTDSNWILGQEKLWPVFELLADIESGAKRKLRILHIGDSHIQADFLTSVIRDGLQNRFGNAGRGLLFPYRLARTNGPLDINTYSNLRWTPKRNVFPGIDIPIGVSGISLKTEDPDFIMKFGLKASDSINRTFDKATIFSLRGDDCYDLRISLHENDSILEKTSTKSRYVYYKVKSGDFLGRIASRNQTSVGWIKAKNNLRSDMIRPGQSLIVGEVIAKNEDLDVSSFDYLHQYKNDLDPNKLMSQSVLFQKPVNSFFIHGKKMNENQKQTIIHGISLEHKDSAGILYSMIGVNGAQFKHYLSSQYFFQQAAELEPDLIIVSLGTNEALNGNFDINVFRYQVDSFLTNMKSITGCSNIIFTVPPDTYIRRKYKNKRTAIIRDHMKELLHRGDIALWDFYEVMGGYGSMYDWRNAGLGNPDRIHLLQPGYNLQGQLFLKALMEAYEDYKCVNEAP